LSRSNLSIVERANVNAPDGNHADSLVRHNQRDSKHRAKAKADCIFAALWEFVSFSLQISDLYRSPIKDGASAGKPTR